MIETAEELRARARDLYRRSDNIPLSRTSRTGIDRVGELREQADALMDEAAELDAASSDI